MPPRRRPIVREECFARVVNDDGYYLQRMREILDTPPRVKPPVNHVRLCDHVFMGSQKNAEDVESLKKDRIAYVLSCVQARRSGESPYGTDSGIRGFLMIPAEDREDFDIQRFFEGAIKFLECVREEPGGHAALVHCNLGVNRSGAVAAAYLMVSQRRNLLDVVQDMKSRRYTVLTNRGFRRQLIQFAREKGLLDPIVDTVTRITYYEACEADGAQGKSDQVIRRRRPEGVAGAESDKSDVESEKNENGLNNTQLDNKTVIFEHPSSSPSSSSPPSSSSSSSSVVTSSVTSITLASPISKVVTSVVSTTLPIAAAPSSLAPSSRAQTNNLTPQSSDSERINLIQKSSGDSAKMSNLAVTQTTNSIVKIPSSSVSNSTSPVLVTNNLPVVTKQSSITDSDAKYYSILQNSTKGAVKDSESGRQKDFKVTDRAVTESTKKTETTENSRLNVKPENSQIVSSVKLKTVNQVEIDNFKSGSDKLQKNHSTVSESFKNDRQSSNSSENTEKRIRPQPDSTNLSQEEAPQNNQGNINSISNNNLQNKSKNEQYSTTENKDAKSNRGGDKIKLILNEKHRKASPKCIRAKCSVTPPVEIKLKVLNVTPAAENNKDGSFKRIFNKSKILNKNESPNAAGKELNKKEIKLNDRPSESNEVQTRRADKTINPEFNVGVSKNSAKDNPNDNTGRAGEISTYSASAEVKTQTNKTKPVSNSVMKDEHIRAVYHKTENTTNSLLNRPTGGTEKSNLLNKDSNENKNNSNENKNKISIYPALPVGDSRQIVGKTIIDISEVGRPNEGRTLDLPAESRPAASSAATGAKIFPSNVGTSNTNLSTNTSIATASIADTSKPAHANSLQNPAIKSSVENNAKLLTEAKSSAKSVKQNIEKKNEEFVNKSTGVNRIIPINQTQSINEKPAGKNLITSKNSSGDNVNKNLFTRSADGKMPNESSSTKRNSKKSSKESDQSDLDDKKNVKIETKDLILCNIDNLDASRRLSTVENFRLSRPNQNIPNSNKNISDKYSQRSTDMHRRGLVTPSQGKLLYYRHSEDNDSENNRGKNNSRELPEEGGRFGRFLSEIKQSAVNLALRGSTAMNMAFHSAGFGQNARDNSSDNAFLGSTIRLPSIKTAMNSALRGANVISNAASNNHPRGPFYAENFPPRTGRNSIAIMGGKSTPKPPWMSGKIGSNYQSENQENDDIHQRNWYQPDELGFKSEKSTEIPVFYFNAQGDIVSPQAEQILPFQDEYSSKPLGKAALEDIKDQLRKVPRTVRIPSAKAAAPSNFPVPVLRSVSESRRQREMETEQNKVNPFPPASIKTDVRLVAERINKVNELSRQRNLSEPSKAVTNDDTSCETNKDYEISRKFPINEELLIAQYQHDKDISRDQAMKDIYTAKPIANRQLEELKTGQLKRLQSFEDIRVNRETSRNNRFVENKGESSRLAAANSFGNLSTSRMDNKNITPIPQRLVSQLDIAAKRHYSPQVERKVYGVVTGYKPSGSPSRSITPKREQTEDRKLDREISGRKSMSNSGNNAVNLSNRFEQSSFGSNNNNDGYFTDVDHETTRRRKNQNKKDFNFDEDPRYATDPLRYDNNIDNSYKNSYASLQREYHHASNKDLSPYGNSTEKKSQGAMDQGYLSDAGFTRGRPTRETKSPGNVRNFQKENYSDNNFENHRAYESDTDWQSARNKSRSKSSERFIPITFQNEPADRNLKQSSFSNSVQRQSSLTSDDIMTPTNESSAYKSLTMRMPLSHGSMNQLFEPDFQDQAETSSNLRNWRRTPETYRETGKEFQNNQRINVARRPSDFPATFSLPPPGRPGRESVSPGSPSLRSFPTSRRSVTPLVSGGSLGSPVRTSATPPPPQSMAIRFERAIAAAVAAAAAADQDAASSHNESRRSSVSSAPGVVGIAGFAVRPTSTVSFTRCPSSPGTPTRLSRGQSRDYDTSQSREASLGYEDDSNDRDDDAYSGCLVRVGSRRVPDSSIGRSSSFINLPGAENRDLERSEPPWRDSNSSYYSKPNTSSAKGIMKDSIAGSVYDNRGEGYMRDRIAGFDNSGATVREFSPSTREERPIRAYTRSRTDTEIPRRRP